MYKNWSDMMYEMGKKKVIDKNPHKDSQDRGGALKNRTKKDLSNTMNKLYKK